jgi:hypothetical protein
LGHVVLHATGGSTLSLCRQRPKDSAADFMDMVHRGMITRFICVKKAHSPSNHGRSACYSPADGLSKIYRPLAGHSGRHAWQGQARVRQSFHRSKMRGAEHLRKPPFCPV